MVRFKLKISWLFNLFCFMATNCAFEPIYLVFIRHAEKYDDNNANLNPRGLQRAEKIKELFTGKITANNPCLKEFLSNHKIDAIYAHKPTKEKSTVRTIQTVTPLANDLKKEINMEWPKIDIKKQIETIIKDPKNKGQNILLSVSHGRPMNAILKYFGMENLIGKWDKSRFDMVWIIVVQDGKPTLISLPQQLLPGDINYMMFEKEEDLDLVCPEFASSP